MEGEGGRGETASVVRPRAVVERKHSLDISVHDSGRVKGVPGDRHELVEDMMEKLKWKLATGVSATQDIERNTSWDQFL